MNEDSFGSSIEKSYATKNIIKTVFWLLIIDGGILGMILPILYDMDQTGEISLQATHWYYTALLLISIDLIIFIPTIIILPIFVKTFYYDVSEKFIIIKSGVIVKNKSTIPFSRIQNIRVSQGPLDRLFKIYTVNIETAGSNVPNANSGRIRAEGFIPGVKDPSRLESIINRLVHQYTQEVPPKLEGKIFEDNNVAFDEFVAYILSKIVEGKYVKTKIAELRNEKNITQAQLAEIVNVSRQTINYLEKGKYMPSLRLAANIAKYFGVSIENIFDLDSEE